MFNVLYTRGGQLLSLRSNFLNKEQVTVLANLTDEVEIALEYLGERGRPRKYY